MSENERLNDARFAQEVLKQLPTTTVPAALEARILADFDRLAVHRAPGRLAEFLVHIGERLWPGAPVWQPASILALSLIVGLTAGAVMPSPSAPAGDQVVAAADTGANDTDMDRDM